MFAPELQQVFWKFALNNIVHRKKSYVQNMHGGYLLHGTCVKNCKITEILEQLIRDSTCLQEELRARQCEKKYKK